MSAPFQSSMCDVCICQRETRVARVERCRDEVLMVFPFPASHTLIANMPKSGQILYMHIWRVHEARRARSRDVFDLQLCVVVFGRHSLVVYINISGERRGFDMFKGTPFIRTEKLANAVWSGACLVWKQRKITTSTHHKNGIYIQTEFTWFEVTNFYTLGNVLSRWLFAIAIYVYIYSAQPTA